MGALAMNKRTKNIILILLALTLVLAYAVPRFTTTSNVAGVNSPANNGQIALPVEALLLKHETIKQTVRTTGTLLPNEEVSLYSETAGKITKIYFEEGRFVKSGDLLVKINDAELQARLRKTMFDVKFATDREYRQRQQFENKLISQEAYDLALNAKNTLKAELDLIKAQIEKTEIRASFEGQIGLKYASEGSYISPNTRIANLIDVDPIKIEFAVPEKYADMVHVDNKINFRVQGTSESHDASIYAIEPRLDPSTRTLTMRAITPNPGSRLLPGSFAQIELVLDEQENAIMIPTQALIPELNGQKVFLYKAGKAESAAVETGLRTERSIQITKGIQAGDTLITSGILQLRLGLSVQIAGFIEEASDLSQR